MKEAVGAAEAGSAKFVWRPRRREEDHLLVRLDASIFLFFCAEAA